MHYSDLPHEILEQIFLIPSIEKRDLLQLQLTCKQWSPVAQKYLYQEIKIAEDRGPLYGRRSLAFLIRSLRANRQLGKCIKSFDFGSLFPDGMYGIPIRDLSFSITTLAYLCPNLVILKNKSSDSTKYLETLANLHRQGFLQRLEFISIPNMTSNSNVATYNATILEFKDTIRSVTFVDGGYDIRPTYLQLFTSAEHLCLLYFSRVHLYQIKDCVSNCGPRVKSVSVTTHKLYMISLQDEYNDPFAVQPHRTVEELTICQHGITTNELAFIMRMFPLLKRVSLDSLILDKISFNQSDMQVITQFFGYLSQMTKVRCGFRWHDISNGLELLPHLAKSLGIKELSITGLNKRGTHSKISILLRNPPNVLRCTLNESTARSKTKGLSATIEICSTEAQAFFGEALESLKSDSIESITITHLGYTLEVEQHLVDYIVNHYKGLQDLTFDHVKFRWNARLSAVRAVKHLRYLHLDSCNITEDDFTRLSWQFQQIDHFKLSTDQWSRIPNVEKKIKIHLPFTTLKTISLTMYHAKPYTIKGLAVGNCISMLKATTNKNSWQPFTLKHADSESLVNDLEVILYCKNVQEIRHGTAIFKMP